MHTGPSLRTTLTARRLLAPDLPTLELIETGPPDEVTAPILFLHGAFAGAWCWAEHHLDYLAQRGRRAAAVSLRGHGGSEGGATLRTAGIDDLLVDIGRAVDAMPEPPVVVAHSLGGYLAQLLIRRAPMRALVLVGSLPPDGMTVVGPQLAMAETRIWSEAFAATVGDSRPAIDAAGLELLFGERVPRTEALRHAARFVPESPRALAEAHVPRPVFSAFMAGLPTLVLNGMEDRVVWPATALRTAVYHGAEHHLIDGGGHFLMLDPCADVTAEHILRWLGKRGL